MKTFCSSENIVNKNAALFQVRKRD